MPQPPPAIPPDFKRKIADMVHSGDLTVGEALDIYRNKAKISYRRLSELAAASGDPDLKLSRMTWMHVMRGRPGTEPAPPTAPVLIAVLYALGLNVEDIDYDPDVHRTIAGALEHLRKGQYAA